MSLLKIHRKIFWRNKKEPAINEKNLEQYDNELDTLDDRIIDLEITKLPTQTAGNFITDFVINPSDGVITVTYYSGRKVRYDTNLEKIPFNYRFDEDSQILYIISDDGTEKICNLSSLISQHEFQDGDRIIFDVAADGKVIADIKKGSITEDFLQPNFLADARTEANKALAGAETATQSAMEAADSAEMAGASAQDAAASSQESAEYAADARASADTATRKAEESSDSAAAAKESEDRAKGSETAAMESKDAAARSAQDSADSASTSGESASSAASSASQAEEQALLSKSYSVGTDGVARPGDATDNSKFFSDLAKKLTEDAQRLLEQAQKLVSAATAGAIIPAGTVAYEDLPDEPKIGYMYNISNAFTTDARFVEGEGIHYNPGANVYWTANGQWDVMIGVQVAGVKGAAESDYHTGYVNITPASIGLEKVSNTADADKVVKAAGTATKADQDGNGNNIPDTYLSKTGDIKDNIVTFESGDNTNPTGWADVALVETKEKVSSLMRKFSLTLKNVRYLFKLIGNIQLSVGDGTIIGAINELNTGLSKTRTVFLSVESLGITSSYIPDIISAMPLNTALILQFGNNSEIYSNANNGLINKLEPAAGILSIEKTQAGYTRTIITTSTSSYFSGNIYVGSIDINSKKINGWYKIEGTLLS